MKNLEEQIADEAAAQAAAAEKATARAARGTAIAETLRSSASHESTIISLAIAEELGADLATLREVAEGARIRRSETIKLPRGKYCRLSRGRGWCRRSDGEFADDYIVGPGSWTVGSTDGFSRKDRTEWVVRHLTVGDETWTIAD